MGRVVVKGPGVCVWEQLMRHDSAQWTCCTWEVVENPAARQCARWRKCAGGQAPPARRQEGVHVPPAKSNHSGMPGRRQTCRKAHAMSGNAVRAGQVVVGSVRSRASAQQSSARHTGGGIRRLMWTPTSHVRHCPVPSSPRQALVARTNRHRRIVL